MEIHSTLSQSICAALEREDIRDYMHRPGCLPPGSETRSCPAPAALRKRATRGSFARYPCVDLFGLPFPMGIIPISYSAKAEQGWQPSVPAPRPSAASPRRGLQKEHQGFCTLTSASSQISCTSTETGTFSN